MSEVVWQKNNIFKEEFIVIGNWNFSTCDKFSHVDYISADTETKLYYNEKLISEEEAYNLYKKYGANWCRKNILVKAYAFTISDGINFALFQNIEDFLLCCATMLVKKVFWYNTKFDFSLFDYYFATHNWKESELVVQSFYGNKHKIPKNTYQSLNGEYGQRYQLRIWQEYTNNSYHKKVHNFKMIDICNIFAGGLKRNLIDWEIIDKKGEEVRKLTMDYVNGSIENDINYMINDTKGLHLLAEKINEKVYEISGFSLFDGDYITAGGLAKKSFLKFMFRSEKLSENMKLFKHFFPMTAEEDKNFRKYKLYQGGKCFVSPYYVGKIVKNIRKYDINSMYPDKMRNMLYPIGKGRIVYNIDKNNLDKKVYIFKVSGIMGTLKENMVPVWYDTLTNEYRFQIYEEETKYLWYDEILELKNYYNIIFNIEEIIEYDAIQSKGAKAYVDNYYNIKSSSKGAVRNGAKLFLNSAYGKLAQRIERVSCHYELSKDGYMHLVKGETEIDEKSIMSVVLGSRITALARVSLMKYIREICKGNPKKYFVYCDTDSVHALCDYDNTDDKELGKMKCEGIYEYGKYLAPKTYLMYNNLQENDKEFEVHTKGVNVNVVKKEIEKEMAKENSFAKVADKMFRSGITYRCLTSLNCVGGKALIYIDKMLLNPKLEKSVVEDDEKID